MKLYRLLPLAGIAGALVAPLLVTGPVGAAITTTTQVTTSSGSEQFTVANVAPKIWVAKNLTQLDGSALASNTVTPYSYYNFEVLAEDDNTLWNARIVICFHNTNHAAAYSGSAFDATSDTPLHAWNDCITGNSNEDAAIGSSAIDYATASGYDKANPGGVTADSASTSQGESWRKARWVLKAKDDNAMAYGVDPEASMIVNDTTNNGTWRLGGHLNSDPGTSSNAACDHATRTIGGVSTKTRWDSTLVHLKCSVRIGTLARATAGAADWDMFVGVIDSGNAQGSASSDASYMTNNSNLFAYCSGMAAADGVAGYGYTGNTNATANARLSCDDANYDPPAMFKVGTNLSVGSVEGHDFGTLLPPAQTVGATSSSTGTDPNPAPPTAANTVASCASVTAASDATCAYSSHKVDDLVANTDHWKFQAKTSASDGSSTCNAATNTKIAPVLGYSSGTSYTCWYATTNPVNNASASDTGRNQNQTYAVGLWEPGSSSAEWDATTIKANQFAFRCIAFPRDANEASTVTRAVDMPTNSAASTTSATASVYVTKSLTDIPLFEYGAGVNHVINSASGASNKPATNVSSFDGMGSDNTSGDTTRIWRRLEGAATSYEAYLHCRIDTSYVRAGTYTGIVYLAITSA